LASGSCVATLLALYGAFVFAPTERVMGDVQRIFYVHLPLAWIGFVAFGHACWAGIQYLRTGRREWDAVGAAAAEIGVLFSTLVIVTGSLWARPVWGTWWTWDAGLVAWSLFYWALFRTRLRLGVLEAEVAALAGEGD